MISSEIILLSIDWFNSIFFSIANDIDQLFSGVLTGGKYITVKQANNDDQRIIRGSLSRLGQFMNMQFCNLWRIKIDICNACGSLS
jgi:hypothetical protein